jgi:hypothetical protein
VNPSVHSVVWSTNANKLPGYFKNLTLQEAFELWARKSHKFLIGVASEFQELISFTVEHANLKKYHERLVVGHHKFSQISRNRVEELVFCCLFSGKRKCSILLQGYW